MNFQVGDTVRVKTSNPKTICQGVVAGLRGANDPLVTVDEIGLFKTSELDLVERPKKKVKRTYYFLGCINSKGNRYFSGPRSEANRHELDSLWPKEKDRQICSTEIFEEEDVCL